jgi:methionyl-tRNA formyltransferase
VLTRADQPAGRGQKLQASPVKRRALAAGLPVHQPRTLREAEPQRLIAAVGADAMVVAAYGLILPAPVLAAPRLGCINIHASLLPRWRGAAPIQRAIEAGDTRTGITIMQMDEGLDTGPMLLARAIPIGPRESAGELHDRLAVLGAQLIVEALDGLAGGRLHPVAQPQEGATYAPKITRAETSLDWREPALRLADRIRAFDPYPGATARLERESEPLKVWRARALDPGGPLPQGGVDRAEPPGTVLRADADQLVVACGDGALALLELQKPGGRRLGLADFLRGFPIRAGERFRLP